MLALILEAYNIGSVLLGLRIIDHRMLAPIGVLCKSTSLMLRNGALTKPEKRHLHRKRASSSRRSRLMEVSILAAPQAEYSQVLQVAGTKF